MCLGGPLSKIALPEEMLVNRIYTILVDGMAFICDACVFLWQQLSESSIPEYWDTEVTWQPRGQGLNKKAWSRTLDSAPVWSRSLGFHLEPDCYVYVGSHTLDCECW